MNKTLVWGFALLILILIAISGFLALQNQKLLNQLAKQSPSPTQQTTQQSPSIILESPSPSPSPKTSLKDLQENIEAAINSKNLAALASYMTKPKVNFIIMSSECCQPMTPDEAVSQLSYIDEGIPMDFDQTIQLVKDLKTKNPRLAGSYIGISKSKEHLVAFTVDSQNKISQVEVSVSWKLYNF